MVMLITPKKKNVKLARSELAEVSLRKTSLSQTFSKNSGTDLWGYNYHLEELVYAVLAMLIMANQYATQQRRP